MSPGSNRVMDRAFGARRTHSKIVPMSRVTPKGAVFLRKVRTVTEMERPAQHFCPACRKLRDF